ncbi:GNAT family N-acetyltransferase [Leifsonia aquatica]|uniref:GNAT family N-acetyltransferase n=1 Tax=Leifsonia aquatica TaxID=144185 RepID=UPI00046864ED|nr:GNAT family N-acetyltransferase [Leifsonia aquatica]
MSDVTIEQAHPDDVPAIEALVREAYEPYVARIGRSPGPLREDYAAIVATGRALVARRGGRVVGMLVLSVCPDHVLVENVAVAASERGTGLGARLLAIADDRARETGLSEVRLYTHERMTENLAYYPRRGYVETDRRTEDGFARVFFAKRLD